MRWPLDKFIKTQGFSASHPANDLAAGFGTPVKAPTNGVVDGRGDNASYIGGFYITIRGDNGYRFYMGHHSKNMVSIGQRVSEGQTVALVGKTGTATGYHVHFQMWNPQGRLIDPSTQGLTSGSTPPQGEDMFNEGDRKNWLASAGEADYGQYRELVDRVTFKQGVERMRTDGLFASNKGDIVNLNVALYGEDRGQHKEFAGNPWKATVYAIIASPYFLLETRINDGDIGNINQKIKGNFKGAVGKVWKPGIYQGVLPNVEASSGETYEPVPDVKYKDKPTFTKK